MNNELTKASDNDLKAYEDKLLSQQNQSFPTRYNQIKIWYDTSETHPDYLGKFILFKEGDTEPTLIGDEFNCTILATRHQYNFFSKDGSESNMQTTQFDEWHDEVTVTEGESKQTVKGIAKWIKANYPKGTPKASVYQTIAYVLY